MEFESDDDFKKAAMLWFSKANDKRDQYPTGKQLYDMLAPKFKQYNSSQVFKLHQFKEGEDNTLFYIEQWCRDNCDVYYLMPKESYPREMLQTTLDAMIENVGRSQSIAINRYISTFKNDATEYKNLITGIAYNDALALENKDEGADNSGIDVSKIGRIE